MPINKKPINDETAPMKGVHAARGFLVLTSQTLDFLLMSEYEQIQRVPRQQVHWFQRKGNSLLQHAESVEPGKRQKTEGIASTHGTVLRGRR